MFAGYLAYQHFWTPKWCSSLIYSIQDADYADKATAIALNRQKDIEINKQSQSSRINLFYSPDKQLDFGVEYSHAQLKKIDSRKGDFDRVQFTVKYNF